MKKKSEGKNESGGKKNHQKIWKKNVGKNESGGKKKRGGKKNVGKEISLKRRIKRIPYFHLCGQTDRQTDGQTDRQTPSIVWWKQASGKPKRLPPAQKSLKFDNYRQLTLHSDNITT